MAHDTHIQSWSDHRPRLTDLAARSTALKPESHQSGRIIGTHGTLLHARLPRPTVGQWCSIRLRDDSELSAIVVAFDEERCSLAPLGDLTGVSAGSVVRTSGTTPAVPIFGPGLAPIVDALGRSKGQGSPPAVAEHPLHNLPPPALTRQPITTRCVTGISSIDAVCPVGYGQRLAVIAPAGTGKSTLLTMLAQHCEVDQVVVGLIGERGREVAEAVESIVGCARAPVTVVVATSDEAPLRRVSAAHTATAIAEYHRLGGKRVLLLIDSLTRFARALREVGLAAGEIPVRHGYPPSVYTELPKLLERSGTSATGSITALYTLLCDTSASADPIAEEVKSLLDGHLMLSPKLAERGIYPAIDLTESLSRLTSELLSPSQQKLRSTIVRLLSRLKSDRELVLLGGTPDAELAEALRVESALVSALNQSRDQQRTSVQSERALRAALGQQHDDTNQNTPATQQHVT